MNISGMAEIDRRAVDKIAEAFSRISCVCPDVKGEIGDIGCCGSAYDSITNCLVSAGIPREEETTQEKVAKKGRAVMPSTVGVVQRKNTTVVNWDDGVKTVVTLKEDDCPDRMFVGFCIAYTKRMLGGTTKLLDTIDRCDTDKQNRLLKEMEKNFRKQRDLDRKEVDRIRREAEFNKMVENELMHMRAAEEAKTRYSNYIHEHKTTEKEE